MLDLLVKFGRFLVVAFMTAASVLSPLTGTKVGEITRKEADCRASFAVVSDTHMKDNFIRRGMLETCLKDMEQAEERLDAVVFDGDITDHGYVDMWDAFAASMAKYDIAEDVILVEGNHDTWGPVDGELELTKQTFIDYNKKIVGRDVDNMYYTTSIGDYPVIVLGSEGNHTSADVSQQQIDWFAAEMEKASKTGLPVFVFFHQSFNCTHGLPYTWEMNEDDPPERGGIGDASEDIWNIISKYNNVFYISGHIHGGFSNEDDGNAFVSVEQHDGVTLINVPCLMYPDLRRGGHISNATGFIFEVYDDCVMLRARNFAAKTWYTKYDTVIELSK